MSNKPRICVAVFHRDKLSLGEENHKRLGLAIFHWAILIRPKQFSKIDTCTIFDTTDSAIIDEVTGQNRNPEHNWRFRVRSNMNPLSDIRFVGAVVIGKLPSNYKIEHVRDLVAHVPLPQKDSPGQNCVSWAREAIRALHGPGLANNHNEEDTFDAALRLGRATIASGRPAKPAAMFQSPRGEHL